MARLTEEMVIARSKQSDLSAIKKLNCWGAELGDVSLLRRMPNVEVLALSINKIRTLCDFAGCRRLRELYVRKNEIGDLSEIRHLRRLPDLTSLWLDENPCTHHPEYRMTVLRNLPNLEKLDNVQVQPDEVQEAMRRGAYIPDSDDEGYPQQQESYGQYRQPRSCDSSPERDAEPYCARALPRHDQGSDSSEAGAEPAAPRAEPLQSPASPSRRPGPGPGPAPEPAPAHASPDSDERYDLPAMTRSHYEPRVPARSPALRHSYSAHSVKVKLSTRTRPTASAGTRRDRGRRGRGRGRPGPSARPPTTRTTRNLTVSDRSRTSRCRRAARATRGSRPSAAARASGSGSASGSGTTPPPSWPSTGASPGGPSRGTRICFRPCCVS